MDPSSYRADGTRVLLCGSWPLGSGCWKEGCDIPIEEGNCIQSRERDGRATNGSKMGVARGQNFSAKV